VSRVGGGGGGGVVGGGGGVGWVGGGGLGCWGGGWLGGVVGISAFCEGDLARIPLKRPRQRRA